MSTKKSRSKKEQIKILVDFMYTHKHFATGEFTGPLGAKRAAAQWQTLKDLLRQYGPDRSIEQWKQTWKDVKKHARTENAAAARGCVATGNFVDVPVVSEIASKVLDTIGHESCNGIGPEESAIGITVSLPSTSEPFNPAKRKKKLTPNYNTEEHEDLYTKTMFKVKQEPENELDILAKSWAIKLNRIAPDQRLFAEKIINDTLFEAEMGTLTRQIQ